MLAKAITVVLGSRQIKIAQVSKKKGEINVNDMFVVKTPDGSYEDGHIMSVKRIVNTLSTELASRISAKTEVTFSLLSSKIPSKEIIIPEIKEKKIKMLINANAGDYFHIDVDDYVIAYSVLEKIQIEKEKKLRILVYAAPKEMINDYYELAEQLGIKKLKIDYYGNSVYQLYCKMAEKDESENVYAITQLDMESTVVTIMQGKKFVLQRTIAYGLSNVIESIMEDTGMTFEQVIDSAKTNDIYKGAALDALKYISVNINRVSEFYSSRNKGSFIENMFVIGEANIIMNTIKHLDDLLEGIHVKTYTANTGIEFEDTSNGAVFMANVGCIIKPALFEIPDEEETNKNKFIAYQIIFLSCVLISVAGIAFVTVGYFNASSEKEEYEKKIRSISDVEQIEYDYNYYSNMSNKADEFYALTVNANENISKMIKDLELDMPSDINVTSISCSSGTFNIEGQANTKKSVAKLIEQLKKLNYVSNVFVSSINETTDADNVSVVSFKIECTFSSEIVEESSEAADETVSEEETSQDTQ